MVVLAVDFLVTFVSYPFMCVCVCECVCWLKWHIIQPQVNKMIQTTIYVDPFKMKIYKSGTVE